MGVFSAAAVRVQAEWTRERGCVGRGCQCGVVAAVFLEWLPSCADRKVVTCVQHMTSKNSVQNLWGESCDYLFKGMFTPWLFIPFANT